MKKFLPLFALAALTAFVSCNDNDGGDAGDDQPINNMRYVSRIVTTETDDDGDYVYTTEFTYDAQDRPSQMTTVYPDGEGTDETDEFSFRYAAGSFVAEEEDVWETGSYTATYAYTLNSDDYAVSGTMESEDIYEGGSTNSDSSEWTGTYNAAGYLTRSVETGDDDYVTDLALTWSNGNPTRVVSEDGEMKIEYGSTANNPRCNLDLAWPFLDLFDANTGLLGYFGKRSAQLPTRITSEEGETVLTYKTDIDGFVTEITAVETDEGDEYTTVLKISYR